MAMIPDDARLLCFYLNANERGAGRPLYEEVVVTARAMGLAGASVFLVDLSYGAHRRLHDAKSEYTSFAIPVVIEVVDGPSRVEALLNEVRLAIREGLATIAPVRVIAYSHHDEPEVPRPLRPPERGPSEGSAVVSSRFDPGSEPSMVLEGDAQRLIVYVGSSDTWDGRNLAMAIVQRCRELGLAGATASLGVMGFGKQSRIHRAHLLGLSSDLPEKIEVVDRPERIAALVPVLEEMIGGGLIVVEDVRVVRYLHDRKPASEPRA
jgi:PII-like signaling protein